MHVSEKALAECLEVGIVFSLSSLVTLRVAIMGIIIQKAFICVLFETYV